MDSKEAMETLRYLRIRDSGTLRYDPDMWDQVEEYVRRLREENARLRQAPGVCPLCGKPEAGYHCDGKP